MVTMSASRLCLAIVLLLGLSAGFAEENGPKSGQTFKEALARAVPPLAGNEGLILQKANARFVETFEQPAYRDAAFDTYFYSNNVGGILVRNHPVGHKATLRLDYATFKLDGSTSPATAQIDVGAGDDQVEFSVEASLLAVAARMAANDQLVLLTMAAGHRPGQFRTTEEMLAVNPALANHHLTLSAALVDNSLRYAMVPNGTYYILTESPWKLAVQAFDNKKDLFTLRCRGREGELELPNLTAEWKSKLEPRQLVALKRLNDFLAVYRLVNAAAEGHLENFPNEKFLDFLKQAQPYYEAQVITREEELEFWDWLKNI